MPRQLHLSAAIDAAIDAAPDRPGRFDAGHYAALARLAERAGLDFVTLDDSFTAEPSRPDALATLARIAPLTSRIGLVPTVTTTHTEPFHTSISVNTLDWVSEGRAGWLVGVSTTEAEAKAFGRRPVAAEDELWAEAADAAEVAARLWDSWEDDAEIRDTATGRFIDRDKLHHIDFEGRHFSVRGPSITPRPPQGRPVVTVPVAAADLAQDASPGGRARVATAIRYADVVLLDAPDGATRLTSATDLRLRSGEQLRVLARLDAALPDRAAEHRLLAELTATGTGVDGFHLVPAEPERDLAALAERIAPALRDAGLLRTGYPGRTLRDHLGLARPASRYTTAHTANSRPTTDSALAEVTR
ncbi:LLM class flavin-dependent oxidoreductase [Kitasatospora cathayae]|uniref:LLM class flavin-dependent oxidoreductase n=1 Tax=Kitasatospora cathayae TaxID=3004092 RepID=A0ABY7Q7P4_9ACTN|nr:LLM class flavin-dependent oxidoreductase [Kitasatospora sp. HUAS 3-15]WBP88664.1 LLM class flavin-dependent oxidoreductase [Kitasatospora sp. HUAS 3-15]